MKVLVVEDEENNYFYVEEILHNAGCEVVRSGNGLDAVETIKFDPDFDIILMDLQIPLLNGYDTTRRIKEILKGIPIIATTARVTRQDQIMAYESGCCGFLAKPFTPRELLSIMSNFVTFEKIKN